MVMPERVPMPLSSAPEGPASTASAARFVAVAKVASADFTAEAKRRSFSAKYKRQILAETDRAVETGGISAILRREGRRCGLVAGQRSDDGFLHGPGGVACVVAMAPQSPDRPTPRDKTSAACRTCLAGM